MKRILLIASQGSVRRLLGELLRMQEFAVDEADEAEAGLDALRSERFDAVVCQAAMPGISGIDLMRAARAYDPDVPFVMVTPETGIDRALEAIDEGASDFIVTPPEPGRLMVTLGKSIESGRFRRENRRLEERLRRLERAKTADSGRTVEELVRRHPIISEFRDAAEEAFLRRKLEEFDGNISRMSEAIGLARSNIYARLKRLGIDR